MKKTKRQASLFLLLVTLLALMFYVQAPDGLVTVAEMDFSTMMTDAAAQQGTSTSGGSVWYLCTSINSAGEKFREAMKERKTKVTIMLSGTAAKRTDYNAVFAEMYDVALAHTGEGDEGDYLKWHLNNLSAQYTKSTSTFEISVAYLDDASMEDQTTQAVKAVEKSLPITSGDSTYEKIYTIYDYLANHIVYDKQDTSNLPHTAYDAIVNGKAVCQGYATLFYRILLDYGIDNRIIVSDTHAWNLVCVGGQYYECDLTWDSQGVQAGEEYAYLLKADLSKGSTAHTWRSQSLDEKVYTLARSSTDYVYTSTVTEPEIQTVVVPTVTGEETTTETQEENTSESQEEEITLDAPTLKLTRKSTSAVLKWSDVEDAEGYLIYRKTGNGSWKKIATTTKKSYTDKKLKKGTTYRYRVRAYYKDVKGSYSKTKKAA